MKKTSLFLAAIFIIVWITLILDFCALHDIANDYLSRKVIAAENIISGDAIVPAWTQCKGEWAIVQISFMTKVVLLLSVSGGILKKNLKK